MTEPARSLKEVERRLSDQLERRERLLKESRDVISSCSRAIILVHQGKGAEAGRELARARSLLKALRKVAEGPVSRYLVSPEAEFVEASMVRSFAAGERVPSREALGASPDAYLLGLLDTVGELKRLLLDSMMAGDEGGAKRYFHHMEDLYNACLPLAVYDHVVGGTRRKTDVARMLVEDARALLTEELRRETVAKSMDRVYSKLNEARRTPRGSSRSSRRAPSPPASPP